MATPSADRPARHRARWVASAVSTLAAGAALLGATPGLAAAAPPHATSSTTHRVLNIEVVSNGDKRDRMTEQQYFTAHNRYLLTHQYYKNRVDSISWQNDVLHTGHRSVDRVVIDPQRKTWLEQKQTVPPLAPHSLGIRSTTTEVAQAIKDGKAHPFGLTRMYGQRVRLLMLVPSSPDQGTTELWVNSFTDQPVSEVETYTVGHSRSRTLRSHWENVSTQALNQLEAKPKVPAGYKVI